MWIESWQTERTNFSMGATVGSTDGSAMIMCANCGRYISTFSRSFGASSMSFAQIDLIFSAELRLLHSSSMRVSVSPVFVIVVSSIGRDGADGEKMNGHAIFARVVQGPSCPPRPEADNINRTARFANNESTLCTATKVTGSPNLQQHEAGRPSREWSARGRRR